MGSIDDEVNLRIAQAAAALTADYTARDNAFLTAAKTYADQAIAAHVVKYHAGTTPPVPPDPPPSNDLYAGLYGYVSVGFQKVTSTVAEINNANDLAQALRTPNINIRLKASMQITTRVTASRVLLDLNGYTLTPPPGATFILELGGYGQPATAVSDIAIIGGIIGPALGNGGETGDGIRAHSGSTRIWLDRLLWTGPFGDEAFSALHAPGEATKGEMLISVTRSKFEKMRLNSAANPPQKNWGLLCGDGSFANSEEPGRIKLTLSETEFNDVRYRCPLIYDSILHMTKCKVIRWNDGEVGGGACELYGSADGIVENSLFDRAGSSSQSPAIRCAAQYGNMPRLTQRNNTLVAGGAPQWMDIPAGVLPSAQVLPY